MPFGSDPIYQEALNQCRKEIYSKGVDVDGELITDQSRLNKILTDYEFKFVDQQVKKHRSMPTEDELTNEALKYTEGAPPYISEIKQLQKKFVHCRMNDKKFVLVRSETINRKTGEVISTFNFKK